jgi:transcriptional regulator with XRE-family HTH domain
MAVVDHGAVARLLKKWRKELRFSQRDVARIGSFSQSVVTRMENGKALNLENLVKVLPVLKRRLADLDQLFFQAADQVSEVRGHSGGLRRNCIAPDTRRQARACVRRV